MGSRISLTSNLVCNGPLRLTKAQRIRDTVPIVVTLGTTMVPTVVFPVPPLSAIAKLDRARVLKRRVAIVNTIGGYQLHGHHYQQICGNERGELCQDGYFHI